MSATIISNTCELKCCCTQFYITLNVVYSTRLNVYISTEVDRQYSRITIRYTNPTYAKCVDLTVSVYLIS